MNFYQPSLATAYTPPQSRAYSQVNDPSNPATNKTDATKDTEKTDKTESKPSEPTNYRKESFSDVLHRTQAKSHVNALNTAPSLAILISQGFTFEQILLAFKM